MTAKGVNNRRKQSASIKIGSMPAAWHQNKRGGKWRKASTAAKYLVAAKKLEAKS